MDYSMRLEDQPWYNDEPYQAGFASMPKSVRGFMANLSQGEVAEIINATSKTGEFVIDLKVNGVPIDFLRFAQHIDEAVNELIVRQLDESQSKSNGMKLRLSSLQLTLLSSAREVANILYDLDK